jgi:hypothetical protein
MYQLPLINSCGNTMKLKMTRMQIARVSKVDRETFSHDYLTGIGTPVIVTDAIDRWPASTRWTFDFFRSRYGSDTVLATAGMFSRAAKAMKLTDYLDYCEAPERGARGLWVDPDTGRPQATPCEEPKDPFYLYSWNPLAHHPELRADITASPYFVADWMSLLPDSVLELLHWADTPNFWLLIGPKGTRSSFHQDHGFLHSYLAQIAGRKKCALVSPADSEFMYGGAVDPERPDLDRFPKFARATLFEAILEPGELLFMPSAWWHHVVALEKSITFSYDFFNETNFGAHFESRVRDIPSLVGALDRNPALREMLNIRWTSKGFDRR